MNHERIEKNDPAELRQSDSELGFDPDRLIEPSISDVSSDELRSDFDPDKLIGQDDEPRELEDQSLDEPGWDSKENLETIDEPELMSTKEQRLEIIKRWLGDTGKWTGAPGESALIPEDQEIKDLLKEYGLEGIEYRNAIPDFGPVSKSSVAIDMSSDRHSNFSQADRKCAEQWNAESRGGRSDWKDSEVRDWRRENEYSWHECSDQKTCELVPFEIHAAFKHTGGVYECKLKEQAQNGGVFDE